MNKKITIVIPFRNEGREVFKTVRNICSIGNSELFDIICIDDDSDDSYDYYNDLKDFSNLIYCKNETRLGVAGSRDKGAFLSKTEFILIIDGHMRIFKDVITPLITYLEKHPHTLFCLQTQVMREEDGKIYIDKRTPINRAARINMSLEKPMDLFNPSWEILRMQDYMTEMIDTPCVFGADYAISREYYLYLHGLNGLAQYGADESFLSVKVWLEGGRCCLLRELQMAHLYRKKSPCGITGKAVLYNRMLSAELLFSDEFKTVYLNNLSQKTSCFKELAKLIDDIREEINKERAYLQNIFTRDFNDIIKLNDTNHENRIYPQ